MGKYPIKKEFFPFNLFAPPISEGFVRLAQKHMKPPRFLWKDPEVRVETLTIPGWQGDEITLYVLSPKDIETPAPCFLHLHGGGFVFEGSNSHYRLAMTLAKEARCRVVYPIYRLAPDHPLPIPHEDCYAALCWVHAHADMLGIDPERVWLEEKATSTLESMEYAIAIIKEEHEQLPDHIGVLSSEFHVCRAQLIARDMGIAVQTVSAETERPGLLVNYYIREILALWRYIILVRR